MPSRAFIAIATGAALWLAGATAQAQSWAGGRQRPSLAEVVAVDSTGENGWVYGSEAADPSLDIRTAYATADGGDFWVRVYVTETGQPTAAVTTFVFIDSDQQPATGGGANAAEIDPRLEGDTSGAAGFETVVGIAGDESIAGVWAWSEATSAYEEVDPAPTPAEASVEVGADTDPVLLGSTPRGYFQAQVDLGVVGVGAACDTDLYFRTVSDAADDSTDGVRSCVPDDADDDGVPDVVEPPPTATCDSDDDCPAGGICEAGACRLPQPCVEDTDCDADEECAPDGRCLPRPGGTCSSNDDCQGGLVCNNGNCVGCALGGDECGDGQRCGPDGRCFDSVGPDGSNEVGAGDEVRGGAFTCAAAAPHAPASASAQAAPDRASLFHAVFAALAAIGLATRRRGRPQP